MMVVFVLLIMMVTIIDGTHHHDVMTMLLPTQPHAVFLVVSLSAWSMAAFTCVAMNSANGPMSDWMLAASKAFIQASRSSTRITV